MKISRRTFFGILLIGVILLSGILLRDAILDNFVKPIALIFWVLNRTLATVDQSFYWAAAILGGLFLIVARLVTKPMLVEKVDYHGENAVLRNMSHWRTLILISMDDTVKPNYLKQSMGTLFRDICASKYPDMAGWEIYEALEDGRISLPDYVRDFLLADKYQLAHPTLRQRIQKIIQAPDHWMRHWTGQDIVDYHQSISEVISFMEQQLESENDNEPNHRNNH